MIFSALEEYLPGAIDRYLITAWTVKEVLEIVNLISLVSFVAELFQTITVYCRGSNYVTLTFNF